MAGFTWKVPPQDVWPQGTAAYLAAIRRGVHGVMLYFAPQIENWMRERAKWTDRTANARQTLYAQVQPMSPAEVINEIELIMAQGVFYGWYLEGYDPRHGLSPTRQGQKYAIVQPALDYFGAQIWAEIVRLFR
ncbi:MAG: hypothetical protein E6Q97_14370 [Desulfurellales bacterium]|nr:MAG: hypothetical protein E6Q97_14370 [Desulfurellales bacterium]